MSERTKDRYAKHSGRFWRHPKVLATSDAAVGLFSRAESYTVDQMTDGHISRAAAETLSRNFVKLAAELVARRLWDVSPDGDGWVLHDYSDHNVTRDGWEELKERNRQKSAAYRERTKDVTSNEPGTVTGNTQTQDAGRKTQDAGSDRARDLDQVARESTGLGLVLEGFARRWQALHAAPWTGPGKHRALADTLAASVDAGTLTPAALEASLDGFFGTADAFVVSTRHRFVSWAQDVGRWTSARSEPDAVAAERLAPVVRQLGPLTPDEARGSVAEDFGFNDQPARRA